MLPAILSLQLLLVAMSQPNKQFLEMHLLFRRLLQKNRFVRKLTHTGLSRAEVHVLIEVAADSSMTLGRLVLMFGVDQSTLSRLIKGMVRKGLILLVASTIDKRAKLILLTQKGRESIAVIDDVAGALFHQFAERVSQREQAELAWLFSRIADYHGQPKAHPRRGEEVLRVEQRRLTRAFGILSPRVFGTDCPSSQWHVLSEVCSRSHAPTLSELGLLFGVPLNSLSETARKLEALGLITKDVDRSDSRRIALKTTKRGIRYYQELVNTAVSKLEDALNGVSDERVQRCIEALGRYVGEGEDSLNVMNSLPGHFQVRSLKSAADFQAARTFAILETVRLGYEGVLPETIISAHSKVFVLEDSDRSQAFTKAVLEFIRTKRGFELSLAAWSGDMAQNTLYSFFVKAREAILSTSRNVTVDVSYPPVRDLFFSS